MSRLLAGTNRTRLKEICASTFRHVSEMLDDGTETKLAGTEDAESPAGVRARDLREENMRAIVVRLLAPAVAAALLAGCATHAQVKHADTVAKQGDWEQALAQYRAAQRENPNDKAIAERIHHAEKEVAQQYLQRADA